MAQDASPSLSPTGGTSSWCGWMRRDVASLDPNPLAVRKASQQNSLFPQLGRGAFVPSPPASLSLSFSSLLLHPPSNET